MAGTGERHVEGGKDTVADEGVDHAAVRSNRGEDGFQVIVQRTDQVLRRQGLGDRREAGDVGEQDRRLARFAGEHPVAAPLQDGRGDAFVDIAAESLADPLALAQALDHGVELARQLPDLVVRGDRNPNRHVALCDRRHRARQDPDGPQQRTADEIDRHDHAHHRDGDIGRDLEVELLAFVGNQVDDDGGHGHERYDQQGEAELQAISPEEERQVAAAALEDEGAETAEIVAYDEVDVGEVEERQQHAEGDGVGDRLSGKGLKGRIRRDERRRASEAHHDQSQEGDARGGQKRKLGEPALHLIERALSSEKLLDREEQGPAEEIVYAEEQQEPDGHRTRRVGPGIGESHEDRGEDDVHARGGDGTQQKALSQPPDLGTGRDGGRFAGRHRAAPTRYTTTP